MQGPRREGTQVAAEIHRKPVKSAFYDQVRTIPRVMVVPWGNYSVRS